MMFRKKMMLTLAALAATALIAGCGGGGGSTGGGSNAPKGTPIPPRAEVKTAPLTTFKFGDKEAKVYEISNIDIKKLGAYRLAAHDDTVYLLGETQRGLFKKTSLNNKDVMKITVKDEKASDVTLIGEWYGNSSLRANDKGAIWYEAYNKAAKENLYAFHDGKDTTHSIKWPFMNHSYVIRPGTTEIWYKSGFGDLKKFKLENGVASKPETVIKSDVFDKNLYKSFTGKLTAVDDKYLYIASATRQNDVDVHVMNVLKHDGTVVYKVEGITKLPRDWAITTNYIMHAGSTGDVVIYNRDDGKKIAETKIPNVRIFAMATAKGNDVYATDDRNKKLYRIDL